MLLWVTFAVMWWCFWEQHFFWMGGSSESYIFCFVVDDAQSIITSIFSSVSAKWLSRTWCIHIKNVHLTIVANIEVPSICLWKRYPIKDPQPDLSQIVVVQQRTLMYLCDRTAACIGLLHQTEPYVSLSKSQTHIAQVWILQHDKITKDHKNSARLILYQSFLFYQATILASLEEMEIKVSFYLCCYFLLW